MKLLENIKQNGIKGVDAKGGAAVVATIVVIAGVIHLIVKAVKGNDNNVETSDATEIEFIDVEVESE